MFSHVRFWLFALAVATLTIDTHSPARANVDASDAAYIICTLHPNAKSLDQLEKRFPVFKTVKCAKRPRTERASVVHSSVYARNTPHANTTGNSTPKSGGQRQNLTSNRTKNKTPYRSTILIRNDWSDLGILGGGCFGSDIGVPAKKAKGASLSFTRDYAANNRIWAAQAMGAIVFSKCNLKLIPVPGGGSSGFFEKSVGVYAQINSSRNSDAQVAKKHNIDTRTFGLSSEIGFLGSGDFQIVRVTPNVVRDEIHNTTAIAVMAQYVPFWVSHPYIWHSEGAFGNTVNLQFDPAFDLQYASTTDRSKPLQFSGKDQSLRLGPELTMIVAPLAGPSFFSNIGVNVTFHPWYEVYSERFSYWWANSIFYNLTKDGNFAVALSYNRGLDENSGTMTNQYILSLNGKL